MDHSLDEPPPSIPPSTPQSLSREDEADLALTKTVFSRGARTLIIGSFLLAIVAVPLAQLFAERHAASKSPTLPMLSMFKLLPKWDRIRLTRTLHDVNGLLPRREQTQTVERELETQSVIAQWLRPKAQSVLTSVLGVGNGQTYLGRDGWLFFRPDVDSVTGPPFLHPAVLRQRALTNKVQPDPIKAILDFRDQLAKRGIDLVVLPIPAKPTIDGEMLSAQIPQGHPLENPSFTEFKLRLQERGIQLFDPTVVLLKQKQLGGGAPLYLQADTHWRPDTMELIAQAFASELHLQPLAHPPDFHFTVRDVATGGDITALLNLPPSQNIFPAQHVRIRQVNLGNNAWRPSSDADLLLLGDSFSNIFSLQSMGWGESAGFAEHLSVALGRPIDCILRNGDGAFATRELLSRELARGHDRLAGKKLVVWEFSARELALGDWKIIEMKLNVPPAATFWTASTGQTKLMSGIVQAISSVPRPGTVPYKDHIMTIHLVDLRDQLGTNSGTDQSIVCLWSMRDNIWTDAARLRPGDRITVNLSSWSDVSAQYEKINRSEIDDPSFRLEEPVWGTLTSP